MVPLKIEVAIISLMLKLFLIICARVGIWGNKSEEELSTIWSNKSAEQLGTIWNVTKFYNSREGFIKVYNDYFKMVHKATYRKHGKRLKMLTPKEML